MAGPLLTLASDRSEPWGLRGDECQGDEELEELVGREDKRMGPRKGRQKGPVMGAAECAGLQVWSSVQSPGRGPVALGESPASQSFESPGS